jgi:hypothetical protein
VSGELNPEAQAVKVGLDLIEGARAYLAKLSPEEVETFFASSDALRAAPAEDRERIAQELLASRSTRKKKARELQKADDDSARALGEMLTRPDDERKAIAFVIVADEADLARFRAQTAGTIQ